MNIWTNAPFTHTGAVPVLPLQAPRVWAPRRYGPQSCSRTPRRRWCGGPRPPACGAGGKTPSSWVAFPAPSGSASTRSVPRARGATWRWTTWSSWTALCRVSPPTCMLDSPAYWTGEAVTSCVLSSAGAWRRVSCGHHGVRPRGLRGPEKGLRRHRRLRRQDRRAELR